MSLAIPMRLVAAKPLTVETKSFTTIWIDMYVSMHGNLGTLSGMDIIHLNIGFLMRLVAAKPLTMETKSFTTIWIDMYVSMHGHLGTLSGMDIIHLNIGFSILDFLDFEKWSHSDIKKRAGFESAPPGSGWVRVLTEIIKLLDSTRVFYIQTTQTY